MHVRYEYPRDLAHRQLALLVHELVLRRLAGVKDPAAFAGTHIPRSAKLLTRLKGRVAQDAQLRVELDDEARDVAGGRGSPGGGAEKGDAHVVDGHGAALRLCSCRGETRGGRESSRDERGEGSTRVRGNAVDAGV